VTIVDTAAGVSELLDTILDHSAEPLYVDLEGQNLGRYGTITIVTIHLEGLNRTFVVDVYTLGKEAFSTSATTAPATTLKTIFESEAHTKVFFDLRNDSDALYMLHNVLLRGVEDVQLLKLAARGCRGCGYLPGLKACVEDSCELGLSLQQKAQWVTRKEAERKTFNAEGGDKGFTMRPLTPEAVAYCAGDVVLLPQLRREYLARLDGFWLWMVARETAARLEESQRDWYNPD
ncbi:uncharacterized protein BP01DRAFT_268702, partial [Aspergillus saccharolyticus JOP 1030-1]